MRNELDTSIRVLYLVLIVFLKSSCRETLLFVVVCFADEPDIVSITGQSKEKNA